MHGPAEGNAWPAGVPVVALSMALPHLSQPGTLQCTWVPQHRLAMECGDYRQGR